MTRSVVILAAAVALCIFLALDGPILRAGRRRGHAAASQGLPTWIAPVLVFAGTTALIGGPMGLSMGVCAGMGVALALPRLESLSSRRQRISRDRSLPLFVDLVAACLAAGVNTEASLMAAAQAVGDPLRSEIEYAVTSIRWGADPLAIWASVGQIGGLQELSQALVRSLDSGASLAELLPALARDARERQRTRVEARTRTAGVRLMAPLGLMFLPAFVLLGVVPVVVSWANLILGF
jgi:pilus assembly protein TadC